MALEAGVVFIDIRPDFSKFREQVRREMRRIGAQMQGETSKMSAGFGGVERSASEAADSVGEFGDETKTTTQESNVFSRTLTKMTPNMKAFGDEAKEADKGTNAFSSGLAGLASKAKGAGGAMADTNRTMTFFGNIIKLIKIPAMIVGLNVLAGAIAAVGAAAGVAVAGLAPLSGLLAAYPSIMLAVKQATGVVQLATLGLSEAFSTAFGTAEEFQESLEDLPEPARQLALEFRELVPRLERLKEIAARGLLTPLQGEMTRLADVFLPMVRDAIADTSSALAGLAKNAADVVTSGPWRRDVGTILGNNVTLIENFGRAGLHLADALRNIVVAAQPLVLWLSRVAVDVTKSMAAFFQGARDSGALTDFFRVTRDVAKDLGGVLLNLGKTLVNIGKAAFPFGKTMLESLNDIMEGWANFTGSVEGQRALTDYFAGARPVMHEVALIIRDLVKGFAALSQNADIAHILHRIRTDLIPIFFAIGNSATKGFGDALIDLAQGFGRLFSIFATETGPLVLIVRGLGALANALARLLDSSGPMKGFIVQMLALRGIFMAFQLGAGVLAFTSAIRGIGTAAGGAAAAAGKRGLLGTLMNFAKGHPVATLIGGGFLGLAAAIKLSDDAAAEADQRIRKLVRLIARTGGPNAPGNRNDPDRPGEERVPEVGRGSARVFRGPAALNPQAGETARKLAEQFRRYVQAITHSSEATRIFTDVMEGAEGMTKKESDQLAFLLGATIRAKGGISDHTVQLIRNAVQTGNAEGAQKALKDELRGVFGQTQMTKDEVKRYGDELFKLPPRRHTKVTADTAQAKSELAAWIEQLRNTKVEISVGAAIEAGVPSGAARAHNRGNLHTGGWVMAPGHSPEDVPAVLQAGEFVVNRKQAERFQGVLEAINTGKDEGLKRKDLLGTVKAGIDYHDGGFVSRFMRGRDRGAGEWDESPYARFLGAVGASLQRGLSDAQALFLKHNFLGRFWDKRDRVRPFEGKRMQKKVADLIEMRGGLNQFLNYKDLAQELRSLQGGANTQSPVRFRGFRLNEDGTWERKKNLRDRRIPRFHDGGMVGTPKVTFDFAKATAGIAQVIDRVQAMGGYGGDLVAIGRQLQARGFLVGEHPAFGGVAPVHTTNSYHYQGRAIDINWPGADERTQLFALWHQLANSLGGSIKELFFNGLGIPVAVPHHEDHAHLAMDRGGIVDNRFGGRDFMVRQGRIKEAHIPLSGPGARGLGPVFNVRNNITVNGPGLDSGWITQEVEEGVARGMQEAEEFQRRRARAY